MHKQRHLLQIHRPNQKFGNQKNNPTVDSIAQKYSSKLVPARAALTTADIYPAIGQYESTVNTDASNVTITLDETKKIVRLNPGFLDRRNE